MGAKVSKFLLYNLNFPLPFHLIRNSYDLGSLS